MTYTAEEYEAAKAACIRGKAWAQSRRESDRLEVHADMFGQAAALLREQAKPIPMILFCPMCRVQHIDKPEHTDAPLRVQTGFNRYEDFHCIGGRTTWDNPPHRSHLCHECGCIWRPADVSTTGVERIKTHGKADTFDVSKVRELTRAAVPDDNSAAVAAIQFALTAEQGMDWLRLWNEGDFIACRREWPEAPDACYVGADPLLASPIEDRDHG